METPPDMAGRIPPYFDGSELLYMVAVFSMLFVTLLALEWTWRICWSFYERRAPFKSPLTVQRIILLLLLVGGMFRSAPGLWLLMRWPVLDVAHRIAIARVGNNLDAPSFIFMLVAWMAARLGGPMLTYQLEKEPLPVQLWPTRRQYLRPLKIAAGVLAISFALTYLR